MEKYRIFIVEDDAVIAGEAGSYLAKWGYDVACVQDFREVLTEFAEYNPHLVLLDIGLPFYNGHYWCARIRQISQVTIIFISSASDDMNIVMAVNMGGDDFVAKPFGLEVLSAKIQALLRRTYTFTSRTEVCEYNGLILDLSDASLLVNGRKLELTKNEFRILQLLIENGGKTVSREAIMKRLWDNDCFVDDNTLTVNMTRLRKKMESVQGAQYIHTKKGMGYMLGEPIHK